jgi:hypothetical protein
MNLRTPLRWAVLAAALTLLAVLMPAPATAAQGRQTYTGVIDGANFKVEMPERWNGTLVLYSHPYYPPGWEEVPIGHAGRLDTEGWLLDHGYALAASNFKGVTGFVVEQALRDQIAVLDWFSANIGRPRRTVASGSSMGAGISVLLGERYPDRLDGVLAMCGTLDLYGSWNLSLDVNFALKTLLAPGNDEIELVRAGRPERSVELLTAALKTAVETKQGRARIALANAFGNIEGWNSAHDPRPATLEAQIRDLAVIDEWVQIGLFGPTGQAELARRAGGNPSWNIGIDYRRQLARSSQRDVVLRAYQEAGLDLGRDLNQLAIAPRIAPDPAAVRWMYRNAVPRGTNPDPVVTLHNTVDAAVADHERWYADQVRRYGDPSGLRQLFVGRATHCAFSAAEEIVALQTLLHRIESGAWPSVDPGRLNARAGEFADTYHNVYNYPTGDAVRPPAFTHFTPSIPLRPSR